MQDSWVDVQGYEGRYQVNRNGEVHSLMRRDEYNEPYMLSVSRYGKYEVVYLRNTAGRCKRYTVKGLLWRHFGIR